MELNTIYNEPNLETTARMPDGFIDLTVTSPPYDKLRNYNGFEWDFEGLAKELFRVTKPGGVVVWVVGDATVNGSETTTSAEQKIFFRKCGFNIHDTMIYESKKPPLTHNRYEQEFEYMFVFSKGRPKTFNPIKVRTNFAGGIKRYNHGSATDAKSENGNAVRWRDEVSVVNAEKIKGNIWRYATGMNGTTSDACAFEHTAMFPEALASDHILSWSNENDIVYDPFMGSGTTAKMCHLLRRQWIGSEISQEYVEIARKRLQPYLDQTSLF